MEIVIVTTVIAEALFKELLIHTVDLTYLKIKYNGYFTFQKIKLEHGAISYI